MSKRVVPNQWRLTSARRFIDSVPEGATSTLYAWVGDHSGTNAVPDVVDSVLETVVVPYREMILGKQVVRNNTKLMIRRSPYVANVVYTPYDDADPSLYTKSFYVSVKDDLSHYVFKCLGNAGGAPSTVSPNYADIVDSDSAYFTSDGYQWKYMYSVDDTTVVRFGTDDYFPLIESPTVSSIAVDGAIDVVKVESPGRGYDNYLRGTFGPSDVRVSGNTLVYALSSNVTASGTNGYYSNCVLTITGGTGSGQYAEVTRYVSNSSGKFAVIGRELPVPPTNGSEWEITPMVRIVGSGRQTSNAYARAIVDPAGNVVSRIEVLDRGSGYDEYTAATVEANTVVGVETRAVARVINSPPGGHGFDQASELWASHVMVSVVISGGESNTIPVSGSFKKIGLIADPTFANVEVTLTGGSGQFAEGESVLTVSDTVRVPGTFMVNSVSGTITGDSQSALDECFRYDGATAYAVSGTERAVIRISDVSGPSSASFSGYDAPSEWSASNVTLYAASVSILATSRSVTSNTTFVGDVRAPFSPATDLDVIGSRSRAWGRLSDVRISGAERSFSTFVQLSRLVGTTSGTFVENETVYQGANLTVATATATFHSAAANGTVFVSNVVGTLADGPATVFGATSGATVTYNDKYAGEVAFGSGTILYVENIAPINRGPLQTETLNFLMEF